MLPAFHSFSHVVLTKFCKVFTIDIYKTMNEKKMNKLNWNSKHFLVVSAIKPRDMYQLGKYSTT
jgi:hypothetical protein